MKKNIYLIILVGLVAFSGTSCSDYLDVDHVFKDQRGIDTVFARKDYTEDWLAGIYSLLENDMADVAGKGLTKYNFISDDMFFGDRSNSYITFKNGRYDEGSEQGPWGKSYLGIRNASILIDHVDKNKEMTAEEIKDTKAQGRFLRAYFYWILIRKYGPVPIMPKVMTDYTLPYDQLAVPRNTYDECVNFIAEEMALAAQDLSITRTSRYVVWATKGAALATRAKAYLYAASPLCNGNTEMADLTDDSGRQLISQTYDEAKWARAAAAAKDVIDLGVYRLYTAPYRDKASSPYQPATIIPPYNAKHSDKNFPDGWKDIDPFESYRQLFNGSVSLSSNPEFIFSRGQNQPNESIVEMVRHQVPRSLGGWNCHAPTLKQVDAYYMNNGVKFDRNIALKGFTTNNTEYLPLPANVALEYANREPRFYASIAYNGSIWEAESDVKEDFRHRQIFYYRGSKSGDGILTATPDWYLRTGVGIKKYYNPQDSFRGEGGVLQGRISNKAEPAIRYADILLAYVEALNELSQSHNIPNYNGTSTITVSRSVPEMSRYMTQVRVRAGLPDFDDATYANAEQYRVVLKKERQIELFAETQRYWDLRRWKDAPKEEAEVVMGYNIYMEEGQRDRYYSPIEVTSLPTVFTRKMYFWPISHDELKRNKRLTQNPGWTYPYK